MMVSDLSLVFKPMAESKLKSMSISKFVLSVSQEKVGGVSPKGTIDWQKYSGLIGSGGINQAVLDDTVIIS